MARVECVPHVNMRVLFENGSWWIPQNFIIGKGGPGWIKRAVLAFRAQNVSSSYENTGWQLWFVTWLGWFCFGCCTVCLERWKSGKTGWAAEHHGGTTKSKSTQPCKKPKLSPCSDHPIYYIFHFVKKWHSEQWQIDGKPFPPSHYMRGQVYSPCRGYFKGTRYHRCDLLDEH